jgi:SAM-dependent methyltransferase
MPRAVFLGSENTLRPAVGVASPATQLDSYLRPQCSFETFDIYASRRSILNALQAELANLEGTVLDVGCGYQPYRSLVLAPPSRAKRYLGLDLAEGLYQAPRDLTWDGRQIPLPDAAVECALVTEVLEHCPEPELVIREVCRVLRPGGLIFLTVPFLWPLHNVPYDEYRYTPFAMERLLREGGFTDIHLRALGGWDSSLAQMIALWVRNRPMATWKHQTLTRLARPVVRFLLRRDRPPTVFDRYEMITGLSGTARKPGA